MCRTIITNGTIVNDGEHFIGSIIVKGEFIESVIKGKLPENIVCNTDRIIDCVGDGLCPCKSCEIIAVVQMFRI